MQLFALGATGPMSPLGGTLLVSIMLAFLGGCSSTPSLGDAMRAQGVELAAIGEQWTEGDDLVDEGEEQIEDGRAMIEDGKELVSQGEANIREGQDLKRTAELTYRNKTGKELPTP